MIGEAQIYKDILRHAQECCPEESCGFIVSDESSRLRYEKVKNMSDNAESSFLISERDFEAFGDSVKFVVHSHPSGNEIPSEEDKVSSNRCGIPYVIISLPSKCVSVYRPKSEVIPFVGRKFMYPINDCVSLVRDFYIDSMGIEVDDFHRPEWNWWLKCDDEGFIVKDLKSCGFIEVDPEDGLEMGDIIAMKLRSKVVNHIAVYIDNNIILHHLSGQKSLTEIYGHYWRINTNSVYRMKRQCS